jgi:anti-anti-sigma factor
MTITKTRESESLIFALEGRLDTATAPQLQETLLPAFEDAATITLDFSGVAYVSSAGLRVLLLGAKAAKAKDAAMLLTGVSEEVMEVLEMTGFTDILNITV